MWTWYMLGMWVTAVMAAGYKLVDNEKLAADRWAARLGVAFVCLTWPAMVLYIFARAVHFAYKRATK